jgi:hypothetical protein
MEQVKQRVKLVDAMTQVGVSDRGNVLQKCKRYGIDLHKEGKFTMLEGSDLHRFKAMFNRLGNGILPNVSANAPNVSANAPIVSANADTLGASTLESANTKKTHAFSMHTPKPKKFDTSANDQILTYAKIAFALILLGQVVIHASGCARMVQTSWSFQFVGVVLVLTMVQITIGFATFQYKEKDSKFMLGFFCYDIIMSACTWFAEDLPHVTLYVIKFMLSIGVSLATLYYTQILTRTQ